MSIIIEELIERETERQNNGLELIASENYVSQDILTAMGSILTNKYAEGYPYARYYGGCEIVDQVEEYAQTLACRLFRCKHANVQPHSGSQANYAAYKALMPEGGKVLSLVLNDGGHLTHGSPVSFSSHDYKFVYYPLGEDGRLDYDIIKRVAEVEGPDVILCGYSAYPFQIDFEQISKICKHVGAKMMVDMAHIAGLIASHQHPSPFPYADIVTTTTHKTLRGPRGGLILWNNDEYTKKINSAVFPYSQGGPLEHIIAAKAVCFEEALRDDFEMYIRRVKNNTWACCDALHNCGALVSGTENHLFLLNTMASYGLTGKEAQLLLEKCKITTNKNMIPGDTLKPNETSGLRIGFAALTTRGCTEQQAREIGKIIHIILSKKKLPIEVENQIYNITRELEKIESL